MEGIVFFVEYVIVKEETLKKIKMGTIIGASGPVYEDYFIRFFYPPHITDQELEIERKVEKDVDFLRIIPPLKSYCFEVGKFFSSSFTDIVNSGEEHILESNVVSLGKKYFKKEGVLHTLKQFVLRYPEISLKNSDISYVMENPQCRFIAYIFGVSIVCDIFDTKNDHFLIDDAPPIFEKPSLQ